MLTNSSIDMLKKILGEDIKESPEMFQEWLGALSKEQLIAEMVRKKESGVWKSDDESGDESDAGSKKGVAYKGKKGKEDKKDDKNRGSEAPENGNWDLGATGSPEVAHGNW